MSPGPPATLPATFARAALRGLGSRCPRCGRGALFARFLRPAARCPACGQDWRHQRADDFPAYIAILVTGHVLAPLAIVLSRDLALGPAAMAAIILPLALVLLLGLLQPAKGAVIAAQWWHGLHGFARERLAEPGEPER